MFQTYIKRRRNRLYLETTHPRDNSRLPRDSAKMNASDWNALDRQAPIPYVRDKAKKEFDVPTVKFSFEREVIKVFRRYKTSDLHDINEDEALELKQLEQILDNDDEYV